LCNKGSAELGGDRAFVVVAVDVFLSHETEQRTRRDQIKHLQRTNNDTRNLYTKIRDWNF